MIGAIEDVRVLTPHCCRHTYVTQMLALGVDPKTIQALVGHAEIDMTMYYAHAQESSKQAAISRYDEAFSAPGGGLYGSVLTFVNPDNSVQTRLSKVPRFLWCAEA